MAYFKGTPEGWPMLNRNAILKEMEAGRIIIEPFDERQLGENSYNLRLGNSLGMLVPNVPMSPYGGIDPKLPPNYEEITIPEGGLWIYPGRMYLGYTIERAGSKDPFVPMLEGRSSFGRLALVPHLAAGFGDIGFRSNWTLEIMAMAYPFKLYPGMQICQIFFHRCEGDPLDRDYQERGHYPDQPTWQPPVWHEHQDK